VLWFCLNFATKEPRSCSLTPSPSPWDEDENQKEKRQKLLVWDEDSLTEWQREKKTAINNTDKSIYNM